MKLVKMSLAAAVLLGASAFALDNVKVDGDAKLYYGTNNANYVVNGNTHSGLFQQGVAGQGGSFADTSLRIGVTGDLTKGVSFGVTGYAVSALGLENNLVSNTWSGAHVAGNGVSDAAWLGEAWVATTLGKTTAKVGRMTLDTPLAFSETWSVVPNTFEAAVLINQDIPDTTLVGAWVGNGNGNNAGNTHAGQLFGYNNTSGLGIDGILGKNGEFGTFADKGAYAAAIVNNSFKPLTAQAWYYNVVNVADAYWLQGDINCQLVKGAKIGAQYANISPKGALQGVKDSSAYAFKLGYEGVENLKVSAAYSNVDKDGVLKVANTATNNTANAQSKLYTEAFWNYGYVGNSDARSYALAGEYKASVATVGAQYTNVAIGTSNALSTAVTGKAAHTKMNESAVYATKSFGPLDATLAYFSTKATDLNSDKRYDSILAMLKVNF